jgi:hypothetical protein
MDDVIEVMKLLCYEMIDLQRSQAADKPNAALVWGLLHRQADALVQLLTHQTHRVFNEASAAMAVGPPPPSICRACK